MATGIARARAGAAPAMGPGRRKGAGRPGDVQPLRIMCVSYKGRTVNALASNADEGRGTLRKASGSCVQAQYPRISEWGNPPGGQAPALAAEKIGRQRERGELKHLSTLRKRNDSLSSGERKGKSPNRQTMFGGVDGNDRESQKTGSRIRLERETTEGDSPVSETGREAGRYPEYGGAR